MKRRKRQARHAGRRDAFHLTMIAVLMTVLCLMIANIKEPEQTEEEQSGGRDEFGRKKKTIFIHAYMVLEMEEQDR